MDAEVYPPNPCMDPGGAFLPQVSAWSNMFAPRGGGVFGNSEIPLKLSFPIDYVGSGGWREVQLGNISYGEIIIH